MLRMHLGMNTNPSLPMALLVALPVQVVRQTADFVREGGQQLEVLLRVKQAGNPAFAFLEPADRLHPFYRCVRSLSAKLESCQGPHSRGPSSSLSLSPPGGRPTGRGLQV